MLVALSVDVYGGAYGPAQTEVGGQGAFCVWAVEKEVDGGHGLGVGGVAYGGAVSSGLQQSYKGSGVVGGVGHQTVHQCVERVLELVGGVCFVEFEVG